MPGVLGLTGPAGSGRASSGHHAAAPPWGSFGHEIAARAAIGILPTEIPDFFAAAGEQLVYLAPEPDRWRDDGAVEMNEAFRFDHYVNLEDVPARAFEAEDRFAWLRLLSEAGVGEAERVGLLPFRIVELQQRLVNGWRMWRTESDPTVRGWIEDRIIHDAGILGHYVTDGSQPHHTTVHFNGWSSGSPNPEAFTESRDFHARFEQTFVRAHVAQGDVTRLMPARPTSFEGSVRPAVQHFLEASHGHVRRLYELEREVGFDPDAPLRAPTRDFAAERLAEGATMLASLWWTAWLEGGSAQRGDGLD